MKTLISLQRALFGPLERADWLLCLLARFLFAAILLMYFWVSGLTKLGDGILGFLSPSLGAFMTRFAALGMIVFIVVQSVTDLIGHGALSDPLVLGAWFDKAPDGIILDQRALWIFLLLVLVFKGAGPLSLDRMIMTRAHERDEAYS